MDPRIETIFRRLEYIDKILLVASGKGGVGKSLIASTSALIFSERDYDVGLLDLDMHGPSSHVILGVEDCKFPEEKQGVVPPAVSGIKFMSTFYYSHDKPSPLRGDDISNAIREILAITRWGDLDYLVVDMPPGLGNETLDAIQLMPESEFLVVTTPSEVALVTVRKLVKMLSELEVPIAGVVENMKGEDSPNIYDEVESLGVRHLGEVRFDPEVEEAIGDPEFLLQTDFARDLRDVLFF